MKKNIIMKALVGLFVGSCVAISAVAEEYPSKPVSIVAVWPAGGAHDTAGRLIANYLAKSTDVPVVVKNVTGAGGSTGMRYIEKAAKDGYTIGIMGMHAISASFMNPNAPSLENFDTVAYIGPDPGALQVSNATGIDSLDDYVNALKEEPGSIINGNDGLGGNSFVFASQLEKKLGVKMTRIPYAGHAPNVAALLSNEVMSTTLPVPQLSEQTLAGKVKTLGVMAEQRHHLLPDVPTFKEQGYDLVLGDFYMLVAPKGVPDEVSAKLESLILGVLKDAEFQAQARKVGIIVDAKGRQDTRVELDSMIDDIYPLLLDSGLVKVTRKY